MNQSLELLRKVLELERTKGYRDQAVFGGLDRFLQRWRSEIQGSAIQRQLYSLISNSYTTLGLGQREEWVTKVLESLPESGQVTPPKLRRLPTKPRLPKAVSTGVDLSCDTSIVFIKGLNAKLASRFVKLGVNTLRDMLYFFPRRHIDYSKRVFISELEIGAEQTIVGVIWQATEKNVGRNLRVTEALVGDETGNIRIIWYHQPYLAKKLPSNSQVVISGKVSLFKGQKVFESPEHELLASADLIHTGRLVPVYPLTEGLYARTVRRLVKETVDRWAPQFPDFLPAKVREHTNLMELPEAIMQAHYPDSEARRDQARRRLAFDELFLIQLGVLSKRRDWQEEERGLALKTDSQFLESFLASLPFSLTSNQRRVLQEILTDLERGKPMCRLLQGEVGSGKTVVATAALLAVIAAGYQGALMAPTEILAEQHLRSIRQLLSGMGEGEGENGIFKINLPFPPHSITVGLLIGSTKKGARQELYPRLLEGDIDLVIGTHALIQEDVEFKRLGLAVVDEQHRFGVMQRSALREKGGSPHVLVMSATPIPRTLALTLYGDLDLSIIQELPPGRRAIKTKWLNPGQRASAYKFLRQQIEEGRQAFIICPLIEESEAIQTKAATTEYERLSKNVFPDLGLGLLHGRMSTVEKDDVMRRFQEGKLDILVSTPVVEVGIDVPNATVMLVEGADRFGLSQLHQFRGRVGRSSHQSYCLLLSETPSKEGKERLAILERTQDGFLLAEEDLKLRGPGEFFGTRQSGLPDLKMARLSDIPLLELARAEALLLFKEDPWLEKPEHKPLAQEMERLWGSGGERS